MNSLTYLSRQFDVLASARTPPSTPSIERSSFILDQNSDKSLKRVRTWSVKPLLLNPHPNVLGPSLRPKRSHSSPPGTFLTISSLRGPSAQPPSEEPSTQSKLNFDSILRRIFFVRLFLVIWNMLCATWISLTRGEGSHEETVPSTTEEKEAETETEDEKIIVLPKPDPSLQPPITSSIPPTAIPSLIHSQSDRVHPSVSNTKSQATSSSISTPADTSRSPTPNLTNRRTAIHVPKTLVLDLDETLVHSTSKPLYSGSGGSGLMGLSGFGRKNKGTGHMVEVVLGGRSTLYHVYKRPFVDYFLRKVSAWYTLVIFTASMQEYADPVIDWLDAGRGILVRRLFRESCTQLPNGSYTKDLSIIEEDLSRVCLIDNSPICYLFNEANGIPIEGWTHDPSDEALLALLPVLDSLRFTNDVRRVLGIRGFS